jgi:hypothetical protein
MIAFRNVMAFMGASLAIFAGLTPVAHAQTGSVYLPPDAAQLVSRQSGCVELNKRAFATESKPQLDEILSSLQSLKCGEIGNDEKSLQLKYADNPEILEAIKPKWVKVIQRIPVRTHLDLEQPR